MTYAIAKRRHAKGITEKASRQKLRPTLKGIEYSWDYSKLVWNYQAVLTITMIRRSNLVLWLNVPAKLGHSRKSLLYDLPAKNSQNLDEN